MAGRGRPERYFCIDSSRKPINDSIRRLAPWGGRSPTMASDARALRAYCCTKRAEFTGATGFVRFVVTYQIVDDARVAVDRLYQAEAVRKRAPSAAVEKSSFQVPLYRFRSHSGRVKRHAKTE